MGSTADGESGERIEEGEDVQREDVGGGSSFEEDISLDDEDNEDNDDELKCSNGAVITISNFSSYLNWTMLLVAKGGSIAFIFIMFCSIFIFTFFAKFLFYVSNNIK